MQKRSPLSNICQHELINITRGRRELHMRHRMAVTLVLAVASGAGLTFAPGSARGSAAQRALKWERKLSRFLLVLVRNFGVAIAISVFFAAARGPSHSPRPAEAKAMAASLHTGNDRAAMKSSIP
jgi:hypothetical protein